MNYYYTYKTKIGELTFVANDTKLEKLIFGTIILNGKCQETKLIKKSYLEIEEYLNGMRENFDIPLAIEGSEFRKKVWKELLKIPYGKTISYKILAEKIGNPKAIRAVGGANHNNPLPMFIPCHRVIGENKKLVGYAGGLKIKKYLLDLERGTYEKHI